MAQCTMLSMAMCSNNPNDIVQLYNSLCLLCRSWKMEDKLTFDNIYELLKKFSNTNETNKKFAEIMSGRISYGRHQNDIL